MVTRSLVEPDITAGKELVELLDSGGVSPDAALWLYDTDRERWLFLIALSDVEKFGSRVGYENVQKVLRESSGPQVTLGNITVVSPQDRRIKALRPYGPTGKTIAQMRVSGAYGDGAYIEDALIYRI